MVFPYLCDLNYFPLATKFSKETYLYWYELMLLMRRFEEKAGQLYGMQKMNSDSLEVRKLLLAMEKTEAVIR